MTPSSPQSRAIRVFLSSTFRDMQAERDELRKHIFPQLRKLCESRGVTWGELDLRWGIDTSDETVAEEKVLRTCLDEVERCRPFFVGMLGDRYGWVPDEFPPALLEREPWLAGQLGRSVTELEMLHGVLNDPALAEHAFFYLRCPSYIDTLPPEDRPAFREGPAPEEVERFGAEEAARRADERRDKLAALKERIKSSFPVPEDYADPVALGKLVLADLTAVIDSLCPEGSELEPLDREATEHHIFAQSRIGVYVGREEYFERLDDHLQGDGPPLVVLGESGSGKSALLANWAERHLTEEPPQKEDLFLLHFIGATSASGDWAAMLRRILGEFQRRLGVEVEMPDQPDELRATFANALHQAAARGRVVLVLDALNQLEDRDQAPDLVWLPPVIPENVRLVLSTLPGRPLDDLKRRGWPILEVKPLEPEERERLSVEYLAHQTKALSRDRLERISSAPQSANPLFLRALLEELTLWGDHDTLDEPIAHYLSATDPQALYGKILERYEKDYERDRPGLVREAMQLLWAARRGLAEAELLDLLGADGDPLQGAYWSPLYLAAEASLVSRSGLIGFLHDYLGQAVGKKYLPTGQEQRAAHLRLADYLEARALGNRQIDELPWQLVQAQSWPRLFALLGDLSFFAAAWKVDPFEVKAFWAQIEANSPLRLVDAYKDAVDAPEHYARDVWNLAILLHDTGHHSEALRLRRFLVEHYRQTGDTRSLTGALGNLAAILHNLGDLDQALILLREEERLCREANDAETLANTLGNQALILQDTGDLDGALALHREEQRLCQGLGDRDGVARSLGNQGVPVLTRGDLDGAMALFEEQERLCRDLGNRDGLASALGNQGTVLLSRGDLDGAMALFRDQEDICRDLGNKDGQAKALGNRAVILKMGGDLDGAMALHERAERFFRELGEKDELAGALGNQALILRARGELDGAMALLKEQERILRGLSKKQGLQTCLGNQALVLLDLGQPAEAMTLLKEQERICRELGSKEGLQRSLGNQANILSDMGDLNAAYTLHQEKERICRELGHPKGLAIALANQASILANWGRQRQALPLAEEAVHLLTTRGFTRIAAQVMPILEEIRSQAESPEMRGTKLPPQPANAQAHHNRGVVCTGQGRLDEAIGEFQAALRIQPDLAEAHLGLGLVYGMQGLVPEATSEVQAALRLNPDYAEAHYNLGVLHAVQGRLDEAIGEFQAALRVKPDYVEARHNLGVAYGRQGRREEAVQQWRIAAQLGCAQARQVLAQLGQD
jgi:tetratricopeptide (TPR) repeat protein